MSVLRRSRVEKLLDIGDFYGNSTLTAQNGFGSLVKAAFETNGGTVAVGFSTMRRSNCQ